MRTFLVLFLGLATSLRAATTIHATGATQPEVQAAVTAASDGDTILIPNGTATWTTGISTTKQIIIRAENYTATPAGTGGPTAFTIRTGATSRNVVITNNSSTPLFAFTSGDSFHCGVGGIRFNEGTGGGAHIQTFGSGTKVPLIFDCYFQNKSRFAPDDQSIKINGRGGVMWNCVMEGTQDIHQVGEGGMLVKLADGVGRDWNTSSTMGTLDTSGNYNFYVEDSTFHNVGACPDIDDNGRWVARYIYYDGAWGATHGFTSIHGGRHWEYYNSLFDSNTAERNISNRYFWCRAGTGLFTGNKVMEDLNPGDYGGTPKILDIGDNTDPIGTTYPFNRTGAPGGVFQPGWGWTTTFASDPIYIWNQFGDFPYDWGFQTSNGWGATQVATGRDIFVNSGAKPGWTAYTYPHPLRAVIESATDTAPPTPDPMSFVSAPAAVDDVSVTMTATTASDATPTIQYFFEATGGAGATDSGWQPGSTYVDSGLSPSTLYTYRVKARDGLLQETAYSSAASATTAAPVISGKVQTTTIHAATVTTH